MPYALQAMLLAQTVPPRDRSPALQIFSPVPKWNKAKFRPKAQRARHT
jgi:hypothetical protein